jgi:sterol desaturase/sphingolipid hydroxylase (fatty acid hydroxylase superfamily)
VAQPSFSAPIKDLIIQAATLLGRILWVVVMIAVVAAWYMMIVDGWSGERFKKARWILINILVIGLVLFLFLLIIFQLVNEF